MKLFATTTIALALLVPVVTSVPAQSIKNKEYREYYVFAIPIDYRDNKDSVEDCGHWDYIGKFSDNIPYCAPGKLQACQLIVDERDTDPLNINGVSRKLKPGVRIITSLNTKDHFWYVSDYISPGDYTFIIRNEEQREAISR